MKVRRYDRRIRELRRFIGRTWSPTLASVNDMRITLTPDGAAIEFLPTPSPYVEVVRVFPGAEIGGPR